MEVKENEMTDLAGTYWKEFDNTEWYYFKIIGRLDVNIYKECWEVELLEKNYDNNGTDFIKNASLSGCIQVTEAEYLMRRMK
jgi:hypothetical protein